MPRIAAHSGTDQSGTLRHVRGASATGLRARCTVPRLRLGVAVLTHLFFSIAVRTVDNPANTPILGSIALRSVTRRRGTIAMVRLTGPALPPSADFCTPRLDIYPRWPWSYCGKGRTCPDPGHSFLENRNIEPLLDAVRCRSRRRSPISARSPSPRIGMHRDRSGIHRRRRRYVASTQRRACSRRVRYRLRG